MRRLALIALLLLPPPAARAQDSAATITFLDVGQGDAIVIRSPEGKTALVDAGPTSVAAQLRAVGIDTIDLAVASHAHADHIGGMAEVLRTFPVRYYMDNGVPYTTATYRQLLGTVEHSGVTYLRATERTITLGSVTVRVLGRPPLDEQNNASVGLLIAYGSFTALLSGDSEIPELQYFLQHGVPDVSVLKAAHHGSWNGVSRAWLDATRPEVVVISVGPNTYGQPHARALALYQASGARVYRTDRDGTVRVTAHRDGTYGVETEARTPMPPIIPQPREPPDAVGLTLFVFADAPGNDHYNLNGEYVVVRNGGAEPVALAGWTLCDAARHCFRFPAGARVAARDSVIVYTGPGRADDRRFFMGSRRAVWNNTGDVATLWDAAGRMVARHRY